MCRSQAKSILTYYEDLYALPFPLPKQDLVAVPDFSAGAMENWGAPRCRCPWFLIPSWFALKV